LQQKEWAATVLSQAVVTVFSTIAVDLKNWLTYTTGSIGCGCCLEVKGGRAMLKKNYTKTKKSCRVTFKYDNTEQAESAVLAGDFNEWSLEATPMKRLKNGTFSVTVTLKAGSSYAFRYVLDGNVWVNDPDADGAVANEFGEENSLVRV